MSSAKFPRQKVRLPFSRSKSGCLICRSQHKKCDERKPSCSSCRAKGVSCQWPPSRDAVYEPEVNSSRTPSIAGPSTPSPTPSFLPVEIARVYTLSPGSARFLEYYVAETSRYFMSRSDQQNPYLTELLPFAYSDDLVLDCILALGGTHLELKTGSPNTALWASWHAVRAVRMLRESIYEAPQSPTQSLRVLLALLLLCSLEVY